jgi:phage tail P2-like protein
MSTTDRLTNYAPGAGSVLPSNATELERALDLLEGERLWGTVPDLAGTGGLKRQVPFLWDADTCPMAFLPLLAWAFRLDFFDTFWPESFQRSMVKNARRINQLRGTVAGLKLMLELLGHPNAQVIESPGVPRRGEGLVRDGSRQRAKPTDWALFSIVLTNPISDRQFELLKQAVDRVKRNCCWLVEFTQPTTPLLRGLGHLRGQGKVRGTI